MAGIREDAIERARTLTDGQRNMLVLGWAIPVLSIFAGEWADEFFANNEMSRWGRAVAAACILLDDECTAEAKERANAYFRG